MSMALYRAESLTAASDSDDDIYLTFETFPSPSSPSTIERLPHNLFVYWCSFLSIETKCSKFPVLSRSINTIFDPVTCCCMDTLKLQLEPSDNPALRIQQSKLFLDRLQFVEFVRCIHLDVKDGAIYSTVQRHYTSRTRGWRWRHRPISYVERLQVHSELPGLIAAALTRALLGPALKSLKVAEQVPFPPSIDSASLVLRRIVDRLTEINQPVRIEESSAHIYYESYIESIIDFRPLLNDQTLRSLDVHVTDRPGITVNMRDQCQRFVSSLPPSLTYLALRFVSLDQIYQTAFRSPKFLPHLRHLDLNVCRLADSLTVVVATSLPRPIQSVQLLCGPTLFYPSLLLALKNPCQYGEHRAFPLLFSLSALFSSHSLESFHLSAYGTEGFQVSDSIDLNSIYGSYQSDEFEISTFRCCHHLLIGSL